MEIKILASGSSANAYLVKDQDRLLLLECGMSFRELKRALDFQLALVDGCLLSHSHRDHSWCAKEIMRAGIDLYCSQGTANVLNLSGHRLHIIRAKEKFGIGNWIVLPFDTVHDDVEPLGFLFTNGREKVLYATDTCYLRYRFQSLTHILIECNYSQDILNNNRERGDIEVELKNYIRRNHMSLETCKEFLLANDLQKVREIYLLHLSDKNSDANRFKQEVQAITGKEVYIAKKGGK